ncbi:MAG: hypothetical protein AAGK21_02555, partial [Bacteroidota bacterium]
ESDPTLAARDLLMEVYHAQKSYREAHNQWAPTLDALGLDDARLSLGSAQITGFQTEEDGFVVTATLRQRDGDRVLYTNHLSRIWEGD